MTKIDLLDVEVSEIQIALLDRLEKLNLRCERSPLNENASRARSICVDLLARIDCFWSSEVEI